MNAKLFVKKTQEKRDLEDQLDAIKKDLRIIGDAIIDEFAETGTRSINVDGFSVHARVDRHVSKRRDVETSEVCKVLADNGLGYLVLTDAHYAAASLKSAVVSELKESGDVCPDLRRVLNIVESAKVVATRAG